MTMTTMGSKYWPQTSDFTPTRPEACQDTPLPGEAACSVHPGALRLYLFGYVTAALASYFIGRDAAREEAGLPGAESIDALRAGVERLHAEINLLVRKEKSAS